MDRWVSTVWGKEDGGMFRWVGRGALEGTGVRWVSEGAGEVGKDERAWDKVCR